MYDIYIDNGKGMQLLFRVGIEELHLIDIEYSPVMGGAGSLKFTMPHSHPLFDEIKPLSTEFWLLKNRKKVFRGRYIGKEEDFYRTGKVNLEGDLNYLVDSIQDPYEYTGDIDGFFTQMLENHNGMVEERKRFKKGICTVVDTNNYINRSSENYSTTAQAFKDKLVGTHGGYLRVRYENDGNYLDYVYDYGGVNQQEIRFAENILDISKSIDASKIITCLIPIGAQFPTYEPDREFFVGDMCIQNENLYKAKYHIYKGMTFQTYKEYDDVKKQWYDVPVTNTEPAGEGGIYWELVMESVGNGVKSKLDISSVNNGKKYIYDERGVATFGEIWGTYEWKDVTQPKNLLDKARAYLTEQLAIPETIELKVVDLSLVDVDIDSLHVGYWTNIVAGQHEIKGSYLLKQAKISISNPKNSTITLGDTKTTLSNRTAIAQAEASRQVEALSSQASEWLVDAVKNATKLIRGGLGGYVVMNENKNTGFPDEILIMNSPDKDQATSVLRMNKNGIGFSTGKNAYYGTYANAWTIDGHLAADFITTGTMSADRMRGGKLALGGSAAGQYKNGVLEIYNGNNQLIGSWTKDGIIINQGSINLGGGVWDKDGIRITKGSIQGANITAGGFNNADGIIRVKNENDEDVVILNKDGIEIKDRLKANDDTLEFYGDVFRVYESPNKYGSFNSNVNYSNRIWRSSLESVISYIGEGGHWECDDKGSSDSGMVYLVGSSADVIISGKSVKDTLTDLDDRLKALEGEKGANNG